MINTNPNHIHTYDAEGRMTCCSSLNRVMRKSLCSFSIVFLLMIVSTVASAQKQLAKDSLSVQARTLINLLDYVSQDYAKAVNLGKIINTNEYSEMVDFTGQTISLFKSVSAKINIAQKKEIGGELATLFNNIKAKKSKEQIASSAQQIKKQLLLLHLIDISPEQYPNIAEGKKIYQINCQSCHGNNGAANGPLSKSFNPPPANFLDNSLMQFISPLQVFNTARLGVQGTGMRAFDELSDKQLWAVAFYIKSLRFQNRFYSKSDSLKNIFSRIQSSVSLSDIAHLSDRELTDKLKQEQNDSAVAAIRLHQPLTNKDNSLTIALSNLDDAIAFYQNNNFASAEEKALYAYLDGIEPLEQQLTAIDATIVPELESRMNAVRTAIKNHEAPADVEQKIADAKSSINKAMAMMGEQTYSFWFSFLIALSILLREGMEAVLIIVTILSLLKSLHAKKAIRWMHSGWIAAVGIGVASWFFTDWLISFGAQSRELMEAFGALIAVIILMYVGFWLHNKTEAKKWKEFVEERIVKMLDQEKLFGLAFISFIVVFREAFESVIFLSSLQLQVDDNSRSGIWIGALAAILIVIVISNLLLKFSVKIPIKKLFQYSAVIIMIFAVVLAGQGVHAFQESGWFSVTSFPVNFHSTVLGIYPTVETYFSQLMVLIIVLFLWVYKRKSSLKNKQNGNSTTFLNHQ